MMRPLLLLSLITAMAVGCGDDDSRSDTGPQPDAATDVPVPEDGDVTGDGGCVTAARENTAALCSDGCDNDGDAFIDADDPDCEGIGMCEDPSQMGEENTRERCMDGCSNDGDRFIDCADNDCRAFVDICPPENNNLTCSDGEDNDGNGFTDCMDLACNNPESGRRSLNVCVREGTNFGCSDGEDNDGDGDVDCDDSDCDREHIVVCGDSVPPAEMWPALVETACSDGVNNDGDMNDEGREFIDCGDFDCQGAFESDVCWDLPEENTNAACSDDEDNDGDGQVDCDDPNCNREAIVVCADGVPVDLTDGEIMTQANARCEDGENNDGNTTRGGDPITDCGDFSCRYDPSVTVCEPDPEGASNETCSDGVSNNGNEFIDCADFACSRNPLITVCEDTGAECNDGLDNDGNGFVDCADFGCSDTAICGNREND